MRAAHEHRPAIDGEGPAFSPGLQTDLADAERFPQACAASLIGGDFQLGAIACRLAVRPRGPKLGVRQGEFDDHVLNVMAIATKGAPRPHWSGDREIVPAAVYRRSPGHVPPIEVAQPA